MAFLPLQMKITSQIKYIVISFVFKSLDICYKVVKRSASEKVASWMNTHITSSFCLKELRSEGQKFLKQLQKVRKDIKISL